MKRDEFLQISKIYIINLKRVGEKNGHKIRPESCAIFWCKKSRGIFGPLNVERRRAIPVSGLARLAETIEFRLAFIWESPEMFGVNMTSQHEISYLVS